MAKKKITRSRSDSRPQTRQQTKSPDERPVHSKDESMDFGGLPDRDLKKNLGCG